MEGHKNRESGKRDRSAGNTIKPDQRLEDEAFESCVLCHRRTDVPRGTPVGKRRHYIEGAGQLCGACWRETYGKEK